MSMEMNKALDLLREIRPSIPKEVLELWCKDRDAFLASHSAVEQAGGDERAAFEAYRDRRNALLESEGHKPGSKWHVTNAHYPTWEASRAALAQPSPDHAVQAYDIPMLIASEHANPDYAMGWNDCRAKIIGASSAVQAEQAEAERPIVSFEKYMQVMYDRDENAKRLDDALARVAELEKQEPVATVAKVPGEDWNGLHFYRDLQGMQPGTKLYAAPVAQAQHSVPDELRAICMLVAETGIKYGRGRHRAVAADECRAVVNAVLDADLSVGRACEYAGCCDKAHPGTSLCIAHHSKKAQEKLLAAAPGKEGV